MKRISDRTFRGTTETNDSFKSYQKNNPLVARIVGKAKARKASNAASMEQKIATKKKKKPHDEDDNDNDVDDVNNEQGLQEQGHEMTPIRKTKRMDVTTIKSNKPIYGPIQEETPGIPEQVVEISIEDAIERLGSGPFQRRILIAAGLCFAADSMEILLLSFLAVVLQAEWDLTAEETASITSSVFAGALIGTLILGPLADRIGRKPVFTITAAIICVFGFATAAATNFGVLLLFRFFVGIGVGGLTVPFDTLAEFVPSSERGTSLLKIEYFWTGGTLLVPVLAYFSLSEGDDSTPNGWRLFVVLCGLPCLVSTLLGIVYVPESPRWLMTKGKHGKALGILRDAARRNGKNPMELFPEHARLVDDGEKEGAHCNFCELLAPQWRRITLTLWGTWAGLAFVYYGAIITVTLVFASANDEDPDMDGAESYSFDYGAIFASASAEIAGTTLIILLVDRVGRVISQSLSYLAGGCAILILCLLANKDDANRAHMIIAAFFARMFFMSASCATWVSTAEVLSTEIRTTGHSAANAIARLSGIFSPYLVSSDTPFPVIGFVLFMLSLSTASFAWNLPETKGKSLGSTRTIDQKLDEVSEQGVSNHVIV